MSNPIVYQTFFSTLKYKNIKIIISLTDSEKETFEKHGNLGSVFKTYDTFNDYFISEETINKLKAIYLKYSTNKSELNDDEKKFLKLFFTFDMDNDSKIESSFLSLNVYIPTEQNKDIANAKIQEFLDRTS